MKVSIITACYNRSSLIADSIHSVLSQDYSDIEYIIIDGKSSDGSQQVIEDIIAGAPTNIEIKYISEPDHGMYEAINKGIRMATGDIIALCHSDDRMYDDKVVSNYVKAFEEHNADLVYSNGIYVKPEDGSLARVWNSGDYSQCKVKHGWLPLHPTCYIRRSLMERLGLYDETYKIASDSDLLVRYLLRDDIKVHYMSNQYAIKMNMGGLSTDASKRRLMWQEDIRVYTSHGFRFPVIAKLEKMVRKIPQFIIAKLKN